jgi:F-type H+-transporting ATPase subunit a
MRTKGVFRHLKGYLEPIPVMLPMNLIGDMGRTISHGFRLFGNILGGAIMATVSLPVMVELLLRFLGPILALPAIPIVGIGLTFVLNGFFGIFAGTIQALVFTLLAAAYIQAATE